jgi:hypothetical protein
MWDIQVRVYTIIVEQLLQYVTFSFLDVISETVIIVIPKTSDMF